MVHLQNMNKHKEFHIYRLKPIRNNIRGNWTKTGKSSKNLTFSDFHDFFLRRYMRRIFVKFVFKVHLHHINKHKDFHIYRFKLIGNSIRGSWTKTGKSSKKFDFFRFSRFFLRRYIHRIFVNFFFIVHLYHMNKYKEFHTYRFKLIGNNIRGSWTKTGKSSKNLTFSDFQDFFYANIFSGFL